jgi:hypothetical protein
MNARHIAVVWFPSKLSASRLFQLPEFPTMTRFVLTLLAGCLLAAPGFAADAKVPDGNWFLASQFSAGFESRNIIIGTKTNHDGQLSLEVVAQPPLPQGAPENYKPPVYKVSDASVKGNVLTFTISVANSKTTFEGVIDPKDSDRILGSQGDDVRVSMVNLVKTDATELTNANRSGTLKVPDSFADYTKLNSAVALLKNQILREKDAEKKDELKAKLADAEKAQVEKAPGLLADVVKNEKNPTILYFAYSDLLSSAGKNKVSAEAAKEYATNLLKASLARGSRFEVSTLFRVADMFNAQEAYSAHALSTAAELVKITEKAKPAKQLMALKALATAQTKAKKSDDLKITTGRIDKLELVLDDEYKKEVPPFKPTKFAGRKDKSANRVAVLELFTGAQCPPCVAADVAFDAMEQAYTAKDVVMIQYHMHIPGPDPMTNVDTQGRWTYYSKLFKEEIRGVPSSLFNGKPKSGGGGGMANSEAKYKDYAKILDGLFEEKSDYSIDGKATTDGNMVGFIVNVKGGEKTDEKVKVRVLLCEEEVRFPGGNGVRFHHQVVRSSFGKPEGFNLGKEIKASVKLDELKAELNKELDKFEKERSFKFPSRPMEMKHLKVIVLVQNDETGEILQAAQMDVK